MNATVKAETPIQRLVDLIEREAQKRFTEAAVERVVVDEASDNAEGDVLKVFVVLRDPDNVDPKKVVRFIGHLRDKLQKDLDEDRFPIVSYFSRGEAAELFPEAN